MIVYFINLICFFCKVRILDDSCLSPVALSCPIMICSPKCKSPASSFILAVKKLGPSIFPSEPSLNAETAPFDCLLLSFAVSSYFAIYLFRFTLRVCSFGLDSKLIVFNRISCMLLMSAGASSFLASLWMKFCWVRIIFFCPACKRDYVSYYRWILTGPCWSGISLSILPTLDG